MGRFPRILNLPLGDVFRLDVGFFVSAAFVRLFLWEIKMNQIVSNNYVVRNRSVAVATAALVVVALLYGVDAEAASGGIKTLEKNATEWDKAIYAFIGVCAGIYLAIQAVLVWMNKRQWGDFGKACLKVAVAGGVPALAVFFWSFFNS